MTISLFWFLFGAGTAAWWLKPHRSSSSSWDQYQRQQGITYPPSHFNSNVNPSSEDQRRRRGCSSGGGCPYHEHHSESTAEDGTRTKTYTRSWAWSWPHRRGTSGDEPESPASVRVNVESNRDFDREWVAFTRKAEDMVSSLFFLSFARMRNNGWCADWVWFSLVVSPIIRWINSLRLLLL
jgi:hypothetical protein